MRLAARPQRLAAQRRRYTEERIAACVAQLGFADVGTYLVDRVVEQAWLLAEVAAELGAHRVTVRRLLERHGIRRVRRTPAERAAAESGRRVQSVGWQARRVARLTELGFADLAGYLRARHVEQGWSVKRMRAELGVGRTWLVGELAPAGAATLTVASDCGRTAAEASVGPRRCCGQVWLWVLLPGDHGFWRLSNGVGSRCHKRLPCEVLGDGRRSTSGPRCCLSIPRRASPGGGAAEWRVIDG